MDRSLAIFITGASSGIGKAAAIEFACEGVQLHLVARRAEAINQLAEECIARGAYARTQALDLLDGEALDIACEDFAVQNSDARLCVVNCAGTMEAGAYDQMSWTAIQETMDLLLRAPMRVIHRLLGPMREQGGGRIVNVLSIAADHTFPGIAPYTTAKAALRKFGEAINAEYRTQGIFCTSLLVGATDTPLWDSAGFVPDKNEMLSSRVVGQTIRDIIRMPADRTFDEMVLLPPKGIL